MSLRPQADAAKLVGGRGRGTPFEFTTISVSDGLSMTTRGMRMSLLSRELIADSRRWSCAGTPTTRWSVFAGCDKTLPAS